uniref:Amidase domain-containing protein n=1 Tax=Kalanchoe fedtschenkoi TaxID=63787 RepID=A0A7N0U829_KALFE
MERYKHIPKLLFICLIISSDLFLFSLCIESDDFKIQEITIEQIHNAFAQNKLTSRQLVDFYLRQIETLNPELCSVSEVNPAAQDDADRQWKVDNHDLQLPGSLHGIPVLLKDSIPSDAGVAEKIRKAGAVILGKVSPKEHSVSDSQEPPNDWCTKNHQSVNPYVEIADPCGSKSGSAISVAANMVAVSLATEVDGSISCSADRNSVVGIKPTIGLTSRAGIGALPTRLGTVGPIGRTVSDAVALLDAIVGYDPEDPEATGEAVRFIPKGGYKQFLNKDGLNGKRMAIISTPYFESFLRDSITASTFEKHMDTLRLRGATIVDNLPTAYTDLIFDPYKSSEAREALTRFNATLSKYLDDVNNSPLPPRPENDSFPEMAEGGRDATSLMKFRELGEDLNKLQSSVTNVSGSAFEKLIQEYDLDAVVTLGQDAFKVLSITGNPGITVPAGYEADGMPFGICFSGVRGSEPALIQVAYGFEQATNIRKPPLFSKTFRIEDHLHISRMKSSNSSSFNAFPFPSGLTGDF